MISKILAPDSSKGEWLVMVGDNDGLVIRSVCFVVNSVRLIELQRSNYSGWDCGEAHYKSLDGAIDYFNEKNKAFSLEIPPLPPSLIDLTDSI